MTKGLFLVGSHPRHQYIFNSVVELFDDILVIKYQREKATPDLPANLDYEYKELYHRHFEIRNSLEQAHFGLTQEITRNSKIKVVNVRSSIELHDIDTYNIIRKFDADFCLVFGTHLIKSPILEVLPKHNMNLHLGLSPWYRGDATLFWPFVMLEPQECGITFHKLSESADSGDIFHQARPELELGDRLHDVGIKCVLLAAVELKKLITKFKTEGKLSSVKQSNRGKEWLAADFKPQHLALIYKIFDDNIVDWHLKKHVFHKRQIIKQDFS
jgi:methionyl-tRNA formyltransferase